MANTYYENLIMTVVKNSLGHTWRDAVIEWDIVECEEDEECASKCVCGKEDIKYLYTIRNEYTHAMLFPIGSCCIKKFNRKDLNEKISIVEGMYKLYKAINDNKLIDLSSAYFSRKLLAALFEDGAFDTEYNDYTGYQDYQFMLRMFNKRDKDSITWSQQKKINAIIAFSLKPYLMDNLRFTHGK